MKKKKRKFKKFFKENWGWLAFIIWLLLVSTTIAFLSEDFPVQPKLIVADITVLYTVIGIVLMFKASDRAERQRIERNNNRIQKLKIQDRYYINLVNRQVKKTLTRLKDESLNVDIDTSLTYLISFSNKVNWICNNKISGKPDSFIIASCLMYSIINHPVITVNRSDNSDLQAISFSINMDVAMRCVFKIISEPITYFEDNGLWIEEKHPRVNISVPNGLIRNSKLYQRMLNAVYQDELSGNRTSIMQFANLLHLIYLNCQ